MLSSHYLLGLPGGLSQEISSLKFSTHSLTPSTEEYLKDAFIRLESLVLIFCMYRLFLSVFYIRAKGKIIPELNKPTMKKEWI
jgi:hypothetical protein